MANVLILLFIFLFILSLNETRAKDIKWGPKTEYKIKPKQTNKKNYKRPLTWKQGYFR